MHLAGTAAVGSSIVLGYNYYASGYFFAAYCSLFIGSATILNWLTGIGSGKYQDMLIRQALVYWLGLNFMTVAHGGLHSPNLVFITMIGPLLVLSGEQKLGWSVTTLSVFNVVVLSLLELMNYLPSDLKISEGQRAYSFIVGLLIFSFIGAKRHITVSGIESLLVQEKKKVADDEFRRRMFLTNINHEIRTPLSAFVFAADQFGSAFPTGKHAKLAKTITSTSAHLLAVINNTLEFERINHSNAEVARAEFSLHQCLSDSRSIYSYQATKQKVNITINTKACEHDLWVGYKYQLQQVLLNLISNAIKHAPGSVVQIVASEQNGGLCLVVSDDGPGIAELEMPSMFKAFTSSQPGLGSSGLGLSICRQLVQDQMQGTITVDNGDNGGAQFVIWLPFEALEKSVLPSSSEFTPNTRPADLEVSQAIDMSDLAILLVEDDGDNSDMLGMLFTECGAVVSVATSIAQAMVHLDSQRFDLIVIDKDLGYSPVLDHDLVSGIDLTRRIAKMDQGVVFGFSGTCDVDTIKEWQAAGAACVLEKPTPFVVIKAKIKKHLKTSSKTSSSQQLNLDLTAV